MSEPERVRRHARVMVNGRVESCLLEGDELVAAGGRRLREDEVTWLTPVDPGSIIALALNYRDHAAELELAAPEAPALFPKLRNAVLPHRGAIIRPAGVRFMHYETELAVIIGRSARRVKRADALGYVKGYTIANDLVVRDFVLNHFRPPIKPKNFDTFLPLGPCWVPAQDVGDPQALRLRTFVNGELRQEGSTADMMLGVAEIIEYLSEFMTLQEDDLILTGTPKGISHLHAGDTVRCEIDGIGALENRVVAEEDLGNRVPPEVQGAIR